ncbi:hypothetical protein V8E36_005111 [Tilletia maclaganii]
MLHTPFEFTHSYRIPLELPQSSPAASDFGTHLGTRPSHLPTFIHFGIHFGTLSLLSLPSTDTTYEALPLRSFPARVNRIVTSSSNPPASDPARIPLPSTLGTLSRVSASGDIVAENSSISIQVHIGQDPNFVRALAAVSAIKEMEVELNAAKAHNQRLDSKFDLAKKAADQNVSRTNAALTIKDTELAELKAALTIKNTELAEMKAARPNKDTELTKLKAALAASTNEAADKKARAERAVRILLRKDCCGRVPQGPQQTHQPGMSRRCAGLVCDTEAIRPAGLQKRGRSKDTAGKLCDEYKRNKKCDPIGLSGIRTYMTGSR